MYSAFNGFVLDGVVVGGGAGGGGKCDYSVWRVHKIVCFRGVDEHQLLLNIYIRTYGYEALRSIYPTQETCPTSVDHMNLPWKA